MLRLKHKIVAGVAGVSLIVLGLPAIAQAETAQDIGSETTIRQANQLYSDIRLNDDIVGPELKAAPNECTYIALSAQDRQKYIKAFNAIRAFAKLDPVQAVEDEQVWKDHQEGAISMSATGTISHGLKESDNGGQPFKCATDGGKKATSYGNLSAGWGAVGTMSHLRNLVADTGTPSLGHRINMLDPQLIKSAAGATNSPDTGWYTFVMLVTNGKYPDAVGTGRTKPPILAWPSAGFFPYALTRSGSANVDWSFSVQESTLEGATVTVTKPNGETVQPAVKTTYDSGAGQSAYWGPRDYTTLTFDLGDLPQPYDETYDKYIVKVVANGKSWEYPVKLYEKLTPKNPTFDTNLPAQTAIIDGQSVNVPVKVTGFPEFTYKVQRQAKDSSDWADVTSETTVKSAHNFNITVKNNPFADGDKVKVVATQDGTNYESNVMTVKVVPQLTVTASGAPTTVVDGSNVALTATPASGVDNVTVKWQSKKGDAQWADIAGATGLEYSATPTVADDGIQYRAVATSTNPNQGPVASNAITVSVDAKLSITTQPKPVTTFENQPVTFTVATSPAEATVTWQKQTGGAGEWANIPNATGKSYTVDGPTKGSADKFRAVATYKNHMTSPQTVTSSEVGYTIVDALKATTGQPVNVEVNEGASVSLTSAFNITDGVTYQWQRQDAGVSAWTDIPGATSKNYSFTARNADNKAKFRVKGSVTLGNQSSVDTTQAATVTVHPLAKVTHDPANQTAVKGSDVTFSVKTNGVGTIQWQSKTPDGDWTDIPGEAANTLKITADVDGTKYRAVVKAPKDQTVPSAEATLTVVPKLESASISADKTDLVAGDDANNTAKVTVTSTPAVNPDDATAPQVTWQVKKLGSDKWQTIPGNEATVDYTVKDATGDGSQIRAVVTAPGKQSITTDPVTLTVVGPPVVTKLLKQPTSGKGLEDNAYVYTVEKGKDVVLGVDVAANPAVSQFQWEQFVDGQWTPLTVAGGQARSMAVTVVASPTLLVPAAKVVDGAKYRVTATNQVGTTSTYFTLKVVSKVNPAGISPTGANTKVSLATTGVDPLLFASVASVLIAGGAMVMIRRRRTV